MSPLISTVSCPVCASTLHCGVYAGSFGLSTAHRQQRCSLSHHSLNSLASSSSRRSSRPACAAEAPGGPERAATRLFILADYDPYVSASFGVPHCDGSATAFDLVMLVLRPSSRHMPERARSLVK